MPGGLGGGFKRYVKEGKITNCFSQAPSMPH